MDHRFETFSLSILELNRYLQKIKEAGDETVRAEGQSHHVSLLSGTAPGGADRNAGSQNSARKTELPSPAVSHSLATGRLVVCEQPADHKRSYRSRYMLTVQGRSVVSGIQTRIKALSYGRRGLTEERRRDFYGTLAIISENLSDYLTEQGQQK